MKQIILKTGDWTYVSDEDFLVFVANPWNLHRGYAFRTVGRHTRIFLHLAIAERMGLVGLIDHKDRNRLNNQRENLRLATVSQNLMNRGPTRVNSTGLKGVSWHKKQRKWIAQIRKESINYHIGTFSTPEDAARAYNVKALELFGEFAVLNEGI